MNTVRGVLLVAALAGLAAAGEPEAKGFPAPKAVEIPMRDGKRLAADLYLPAAEPEGRFPAVLIQTPYNRAAYAKPGNEHALVLQAGQLGDPRADVRNPSPSRSYEVRLRRDGGNSRWRQAERTAMPAHRRGRMTLTTNSQPSPI